MKNFYRPVIHEQYKYITLVYVPQVASVAKMIKEHYDNEEHNDTVFFINTFYDNEGYTLSPYYFPQKRKIYYNLEHANNMLGDCELLLNFFKDMGMSEIWSMEPGVKFIEDNYKLEFMPVRYTSLIEKSHRRCDKTIDFGFVGIVNKSASLNRLEFFDDYIYNYDIDFSIKILNGETINTFKDELESCRYILDIKRFKEQVFQNQVRLFEHICLGHTVLSEKCDINMFPGLIHEWEDIKELNRLYKDITPQDVSDMYKEMTYTDEAYSIYKQNILEKYEQYKQSIG